MSRVLLANLSATAAILLAGCATVVNDDLQRIHVTSDPEGALTRLICNATTSEERTTPVALEVPRGAIGCAVAVRKEGYAPQKVTLERTHHGAYWGNLAFFAPLVLAVPLYAFGADPADNEVAYGIVGGLVITGITGFVADRRTQKAFAYEPEEVHVVLKPSP